MAPSFPCLAYAHLCSFPVPRVRRPRAAVIPTETMHACGRRIHTPSHTTQHVYAKGGESRDLPVLFVHILGNAATSATATLTLSRRGVSCVVPLRHAVPFPWDMPPPSPFSAGAWAGHSPRTPEAGGRRRRGEWERRQESLVVHDGMRPCPGARGPPQRQRPQRVAHSCWLEWHFWVSWEQNCSQTATGACGQGQTETYTQQRPRHNGADPAKQTPKLSPRQVCVCVCADVQHWRTGAASWRSMSV